MNRYRIFLFIFSFTFSVISFAQANAQQDQNRLTPLPPLPSLPSLPSSMEQARQKIMQKNMATMATMATSAQNAPNIQVGPPKLKGDEQHSNYDFFVKMRKMMVEKMRRSGGTGWEPTAWQKTLPPIVVQEGNAIKEYSFTDLINADGYLCLGSARAYKALQLALPILYKNSTPVKGDFKITYGASICTSLVYDFFMQGYTDKRFLELDKSTKQKLITLERLSTGKKVTVVFPFSTIRGHTPEAAQAGDVILHAQDGDGVKLYVEEGKN